jgi:hypothetical protein
METGTREGPARPPGLSAAIAVVVALATVVAIRLLYNLMQQPPARIDITGDEPSYIMLAQAVTHGSVHIYTTITHDLARRVFGNTYPPGATVANVESYRGPTGIVSPFAPGVSLLLAPFVAVLGPVSGGVLGMIVWVVAGLAWIHQRTSRLFRLGAGGQAVLGLCLAMPAVLVAATQIYPDLPSGILLGAAALELVALERSGRLGRLRAAVLVVSIGFSWWLQPKNLVPAAVLVVAWVAVVVWRGPPGDRVVLAVSLVVLAASVAAFFAYNLHYMGHWLGLPEPRPRWSRQAEQLTLGLLFDRDQGLFVQVPWALVGLGALVAFGVRRAPVAVAATLAAFASVLLLNGTYTSNPYGGLSFAGRFMWTLIPLSVPWVALVLERAERRHRSLVPALAVVALAFVWQAEPILAQHHDYYNALALDYQPYPGWWPKLLGVLPQFARTTRVLGVHPWTLIFELVVALAGLAVVLWWSGAGRSPVGRHSVT